jgi:hypothetical protein
MLALALLAAVVAACLPGGQMSGAQMPVGSRQLIITVTNNSPVPVPVEVAETGLCGTGGGTVSRSAGRTGSVSRSPRRCHQARTG